MMNKVTQKKTNLRSEELQQIITKIPNWILRKGNTIIFLILLLLLVLSFFIKYPETIKGEVVITSLDPAQKIFFNTSGKIDTIFCKNNDSIISGQPIALVENSANFSNIQLLKKTIKAYPLSIDNLEFPIDNLPVLLLGDIDPSFSNFENSYIKYLLLKKYKDYDIVGQSNLNDVLDKKRKLISLRNQISIDASELQLKNQDLERYKELFKKGVISKQEMDQKEISFLQTKKLAKNTQLAISEINNQISLSQKNLQLNDIDKIRASKQLVKQVIQNYNKLKISINEWEKKYLIQSSRAGLVSYSNYRKINDFVKAGELMVSVVPQNGFTPIAKIKIPVFKSGKVKIGQKVKIKLDNFPYLEYGLLEGEIINISLLPDQENKFLLDVTLKKGLTTSYNKTLPLKHEMIGSANVITEDLRLIERLFNNLRYLISKN